MIQSLARTFNQNILNLSKILLLQHEEFQQKNTDVFRLVSKSIIFSHLGAKCGVRVNETRADPKSLCTFSGFKSRCKIPRLWQYRVQLRIYRISSCSTQKVSQLRTRRKLNNFFTFTMSGYLNFCDPAPKALSYCNWRAQTPSTACHHERKRVVTCESTFYIY
jgi:hypothetical protein